MADIEKLTLQQKEKDARRVIVLLDGFSYHDAKEVLSVADSLLDGMAIVRSSQRRRIRCFEP